MMKLKNLSKVFLISFFVMGGFKSLTASDSTVRHQSGVYTGIALGYSSMKSKSTERYYLPLPPPLTLNSTDSGRKTNKGIGGDFFLGYRHIFANGLMTGLDFALAWDSNKINHDYNLEGFLTRIRVETPYKFIPGVVIGSRFLDRFLTFVKLGMSFTEFRVVHSIENRSTTPKLFESSRKRKAGYYGSAGLEIALTDRLSTLALVSYEHYGKISKTLNKRYITVDGAVNEISVKPRYFAAKVGLVYRFNCFS